MTYPILINGESFSFGMDDVVDYLRQYGVVSDSSEESGWLANTPLDWRHYYRSTRLYFTCRNAVWEFGSTNKDENIIPQERDIAVAVRAYLELA